MKKQYAWSQYYDLTQDGQPSALLVRALPYVLHKGDALDVGAGALKDSKLLLSQGFNVTAVDSEPQVAELADKISSDKFELCITPFESFDFPKKKFDLVSAMMSLPFEKPQTFNAVFGRIKDSLKKGGIFCGQFFGLKDSWNVPNSQMTFHDSQEIAVDLAQGLEPIEFWEEEKEGMTARGAVKHWHVFHLIARKH